MSALSITELERLITIMRKMQHQVSCGNWQELEELDSERRALLNDDSAVKRSIADSQLAALTQEREDVAHGSDNVPHSPTEQRHRSLVEEIRNLDKQIINEALAARAELLAKNRGLNDQVKAKNLYAQANSFT